MENSRVVALRKSFRFTSKLVFWIPVTFFSLLLVRNTLPYFSFSPSFSFIEERALLFVKPIYKFSFYIHIFAGMFCIVTALIQFSSIIIKKRKAIHIWSGRIYVAVVLLLGSPTGLYMAFFAKGSFWERALFVFMAVYWFYATVKGLQSILSKHILEHKIWMIRSYCMAMTAVTFRIYHLVFYSIGWGHLENYEISLWISVLGNIFLAEYYIRRKNNSYFKSHL